MSVVTESRQPQVEERQSRAQILASSEELAKLHPVERILVKIFEFCSSLKLAVFLMAWLIVESVTGAKIESDFGQEAAKYFTYFSLRFSILLALLGLNVTCAALIRFPWKRYQVGFLVTHTGLVTLLVGSYISFLGHNETQMVVTEGQKTNTVVVPDQPRILIRDLEPGKQSAEEEQATVSIPANMGPLSWGQKLLWFESDTLRWKPTQKTEFDIGNGEKLKVLNYLANCAVSKTWRKPDPKENGPTTAVVDLMLVNDATFGKMPISLTLNQGAPMDMQSIGFGARALIGRATTKAEADHFLNAYPKDGDYGQIGSLGISYAGKHATVRVDKLQKGPVELPDLKATVILEEYSEGYKFRGREVGAGIRIKLKTPTGEQVIESLAEVPLINPAMFATEVATKPQEAFATLFPSSISTQLQAMLVPDGKLALRSIYNNGEIKSVLVSQDKLDSHEPLPTFNGSLVKVTTFGESLVEDYDLVPKPLDPQNRNLKGMLVELSSADGKSTIRTNLGLERPVRRFFNGRWVEIVLARRLQKLPFTVKLEKFHRPLNPGTQQAAMFTSDIRLIDNARDDHQYGASITMNVPLVYDAPDGRRFKVFQADFDEPSQGAATSIFQVVYDPGLDLKYLGSLLLCCGTFLMFYLGGYFKGRPRLTKPN